MNNFGDLVRRYRKEAGLTQSELGVKLGLQKSAVAKYENGRIRHISIDIVQKFADALGLSIHDLLSSAESNLYALDFTIDITDDEVLVYDEDKNNKEPARFTLAEWDAMCAAEDLSRVYEAFGYISKKENASPKAGVASTPDRRELLELIDSLPDEAVSRLLQIARLALGE